MTSELSPLPAKRRSRMGTRYRQPAGSSTALLVRRVRAALGLDGSVGPTFMIVGAMKAGTSTLHATLAHHPEIFMTSPKELHAWDRENPPPLASYHMHFDAGRDKRVRGESTPSYAFQPGTMEHLKKYNPNLQLVFIMRDPVRRAISNINHSMSKRDIAERPLMEELMDDLRDMSKNDVSPFRHSPFGYHERGLYHRQIVRMRKHFAAEQLLLLRLEDFKAAPQAELDKVCDFLGVGRETLKVRSKGVNTYAAPPQEVVDYLSNFYRPHNRILTQDFGIRTDDWL
jgi:hypothetical protein